MARKLWINSTHSFGLHKSLTNPPWHYFISLGFGHCVPLDDFPDPALPIKSFDLVTPSLARTSLDPSTIIQPIAINAPDGVVVEKGDVCPRKITIGDTAESGTYQVVAETVDTFYTMYMVDGNMQFAMKPLDEMQGKNVVSCTKLSVFAKTYLKHKEWKDPKPLGLPLEITPLQDISDIHVGDWVTFKVDFMGQPFSCTQESMEFMMESSNTFGGEAGGEIEGAFMCSYVINGRSRMRVPTAGQWLVNVFASQDVNEYGPLKSLVGKCNKVYFSSSATFNVKA